MDFVQAFQTILEQIPNLAVAVWMLYRQQGTIDTLLNSQKELVDRLLRYVDNDKQLANQIQVSAARKGDTGELKSQ